MLVFGTPRAGTSLFYLVLAQYLDQAHGIRPLGEYFNVFTDHFVERDGEIILATNPFKTSEKISDEHASRLLEWRFKLLKKYEGQYSFKLLSDHARLANSEVTEWLADRYDWIFVERRNLFEQFLSYLVSISTGKWYVRGGIQVQPRSLTPNPVYAEFFESLYRQYIHWKQRLQPKRVLVYEDFADHPDRRILLAAGFTRNIRCRYDLAEKQNHGDKLALFSSPDTIIELYRETGLQEIYPFEHQVAEISTPNTDPRPL